MQPNHPSEHDESKCPETQSARLEKRAENVIREDSKPIDRKALVDRQLESEAKEQKIRAVSPDEAAAKAKRGEKVVGDATKALGFSLSLVNTEKDGAEDVILPGRTPQQVKVLQDAEASCRKELPFDPDELQGKAITEDLPRFDEQLKEQLVPAGTGLEIRGHKYALNQLSAQGLDTASDATPEPGISENPRVVGSDGVARYAGHISNVPEISKGISSTQDLEDLRKGVLQGIGNSVLGTLDSLSQPKAVENALLGIGPALDASVDYYNKTSAEQVIKDATQFAGAGLQALENNLGHPLTQNEIGTPTGEAATFFIPIGASKVLKAQEIDALGGMQKLEKLNPEDLAKFGVRRFEMPKVNLERDQYSIQGSIPGDSRAWMRAETPRPGVVDVTAIDKGGLPDGTGGEFMAIVMRGHDAIPTKQLNMANVTNKETLAAYAKGIPAEETLLGKCATKALRSLGITPTSFRYEWIESRQRLNILIETSR